MLSMCPLFLKLSKIYGWWGPEDTDSIALSGGMGFYPRRKCSPLAENWVSKDSCGGLRLREEEMSSSGFSNQVQTSRGANLGPAKAGVRGSHC